MIRDFDPHHKARTIIGSMRTCLRDLKNAVPPICSLQKLELWDKQWDKQKAKMKQMRTQDMASLPKRIKTMQDTQAVGSSTADASGTRMITHISLNAKFAHVIGIPHEALIEGGRVGTGSFGICR